MRKNDIDKFVERITEVMPKIGKMFSPKFSRNMFKEMLNLDINMPHVVVMKYISEKKTPPIISEIGKGLSIPFAMMTRIIDRIESKQLAARIRDSNDRRIYRINLTSKGKELTKRATEMHKEYMISLVNTFEEKDRAEYIEAMNKIISILLKYKDSKPE